MTDSQKPREPGRLALMRLVKENEELKTKIALADEIIRINMGYTLNEVISWPKAEDT